MLERWNYLCVMSSADQSTAMRYSHINAAIVTNTADVTMALHRKHLHGTMTVSEQLCDHMTGGVLITLEGGGAT